MNRTVLQVPMTIDLKEQAELVSFDYGFSSLQEVVRFMLNKLARRELSITVSEVEEIKSLSQASQKRYKQALTDIKNKKNIYKPKNSSEFLKMLRT
ncbi:MAG: hypothetical protein AAB437_03315 [Patescibacteria group bacterium]